MGLRSSGHNEGALCVALPGKGLATGALPQCVCVRGGGGMRALGRPVCPVPARVLGAQPRLLSGASTRESRGPGPRARAPVRPPDRLQFHSCTAPPHCPLGRPVRRGWGGKGGVRGQGPRQHRRQRRSGAPRGGGGGALRDGPCGQSSQAVGGWWASLWRRAWPPRPWYGCGTFRQTPPPIQCHF